MTRSATRIAALSATFLVALSLAACGGHGDDDAATPPPVAGGTGDSTPPRVAVDELSSGGYIVSVGDPNMPTVGKYYAGTDGRRLLLLTDDSDALGTLYRREATGPWVAVPAPTRDVRVTFLNSNALPVASLTAAALAGRYVVALGNGTVASFSLTAEGSIGPGSSGCKLSGSLTPSALPQTLGLTLSSSGCVGVPATSNGVLVVDSDYAPARFRLVTDNGERAVDLWAFLE